ncbi:hypothetical protein [Macrococcoides canis]|uniref:hypothetical protein n=1 Tax=Macrococcoides canis TaxID=1855823 RepID=UPI0020B8C068|nr:hypothetical protein [Macrococcus canis]UTG99708.1 hypothetical protein KFV04_09575 [Macrococcus canis]
MRIDINLHIRQPERAETSESAHTTARTCRNSGICTYDSPNVQKHQNLHIRQPERAETAEFAHTTAELLPVKWTLNYYLSCH